MTGKLIITATPIGNMGDISERAIETLRSSDVIACEDTRHTMKILTRFDIKQKRLISYHEHNKAERGEDIINLLTQGLTVALVSDAGMPAISDPGADVASKAINAGIEVSVIPGASASLSALVLSGLNTEHFVFEGFMPKDKKERRAKTEALMKNEYTTIVYAAPHDLVDTLTELNAFDAERKIAVAHELTKIHESVHRGTINEILDYFKNNEPRGEYVIVLDGKAICEDKSDETEQKAAVLINKMLNDGFSVKDITKVLVYAYGLKRSRAYNMTLLQAEDNKND